MRYRFQNGFDAVQEGTGPQTASPGGTTQAQLGIGAGECAWKGFAAGACCSMVTILYCCRAVMRTGSDEG